MSDFVMPSTTKDRESIKGALNEIVDHLTMIDSYREKIKEVGQFLKDEFGMPPALANKSAKIVHKNSFAEEVTKFEEIENIHELVIKKVKS